MAAKAGAHAVDGKHAGGTKTATRTASNVVREWPPSTYTDSINGRRRPKYGKKGKLAQRYYEHELTALQEESSSCSTGSSTSR